MTAACSLFLLLVALAAGSGLAPGLAHAQVCGDGVVDLGEACDEGPATGTPESCCTAGCTLRDAGETCRPLAGPCDVAEVCDGAAAACPADATQPDGDGDGVCDPLDVCPATPDPAQEDGDGDGVGTVCDPCTTVPPVTLDKAVLKMAKLLAPLGDDRFKLKVTALGIPLLPALDPVVEGLRFILTDALGTIVVDGRLPGGAYSVSTRAGWKGSTHSWTYTNGGQTLPLIQGLAKVTIRGRASQPGQYTISVVAKNGSYGLPGALPLAATIVLDPPLATTGQCIEVGFPAPGQCIAGSNGTVTCR